MNRRYIEESDVSNLFAQVSGIDVVYDMSQPERERLVSMKRDGRPIEPTDKLTVALGGFLAEGGDLYDVFPEATTLKTMGKVSDIVIDYFRQRDMVRVPPRGRQTSAR